MIYFTTFIFTLLLSHIAHTAPACGDVTPTKELNDPVYADAQHAATFIPLLFDVTWSKYYDNKTGDTSKVTCSNLAKDFPYFGKFPRFPYIGGAYNVNPNSSLCGSCWELTNVKTRRAISVTLIDSAKTGYNISEEAFEMLNRGPGTKLLAEAKYVSPHPCGIKSK